MDFLPIDNLKNTRNILEAVTYRQKMASNNIANAHTPGYTAKSVNFSDLLGDAANPFATGLSQKMGTIMPEATSTGAPVEMSKEFIDMQKNMLYYSMATRRLTTIFNTLKTASQIGR